MTPFTAATREISPRLASCELTHQERVPIDVALARVQHERYERCLVDAGCTIVAVDPAPELADSVFVEDIAVVFDEIAIMTRPGAPSRRGETEGVAAVLGRYRPLRYVDAPATIDGGDVLVVGRRVFVGCATRTNAQAVHAMQTILDPFGYVVRGVRVDGCLHLKSAVTAIDEARLLINRRWAAPEPFDGFTLVDVHPDESHAANVVRVGETLIYPIAYPRTAERLATLGYRLVTADLSEIAKAEGAVTCCSLIWRS